MPSLTLAYRDDDRTPVIFAIRERDQRLPRRNRMNPLTLWDLHWVKGLDDAGFIDGLVKRLSF